MRKARKQPHRTAAALETSKLYTAQHKCLEMGLQSSPRSLVGLSETTVACGRNGGRLIVGDVGDIGDIV